MFIKKVQIENFKRFTNLELDLQPFDCLVGSNNSGKTTLLQALALFDFCVDECLSRRNGKAEIEIKRRSIAPEEFYVLPVADPKDLWSDRKTQTRNNHIFIKIIVTFEEGQVVTATVDLSYNRYAVSVESSDESQAWLNRLAEFTIFYLPVFSTFLPQEERRTPAVISDELARGRVNSVIRNLLLNLQNTNRQSELEEILRRSFPGLDRLSIQFDELSQRYISVTYQERDHSREFDIFSAGSGFQQFIYLFGFILLQQPTVILLDEPDVHLHGNLQKALLNELRLLVENGKQVLFATHSSDLIKQMSPENILVLDEAGAERLAVDYDVYDTLDKLGSVEITQLPVVQAYKRVLVVEDQSDWDLLQIFCAKVLEPGDWQQVIRRLAICYAHGNPWRQDMPGLRQKLQQVIARRGRPLRMFVVADRDYHPYPSTLLDTKTQQDLEWHIWERNEIENYLLVPDAIERVLHLDDVAGRQTSLLTQALRDEFERLLESSRDRANDMLVKAFDEISKSQKKGWDASTCSKLSREYLQEHWQTAKVALGDAKEIVLPGMKRWAQKQGIGQFSDKALANGLLSKELPPEIHDLARRLAAFAGVR